MAFAAAASGQQRWRRLSSHRSLLRYEHRPTIGISAERLAAFERELLETLEPVSMAIQCWVVLPNHYHTLLLTADVRAAL